MVEAAVRRHSRHQLKRLAVTQYVFPLTRGGEIRE